MLSVSNLKTEYMVNPIGIDVTRPRFSWQLASAARAQMQRGYQLLVASSQANLDANIGDKWDSGQVTSDQSTQLEYNGSALASRARYYWKVRVWDANNTATAWSAGAFFELGLLNAADWTARWIAETGTTWTDYSLDLDVTIVNDRAGIVFRARDENNLYMWQVARASGAKLVPHVRVNGAWSVLKTVDIAAAIPASREAGENHVRIELAGSTIRTIVNGMLVDTTSHTSFNSGTIGFRTNGAEHGLFDNVVVAAGGATLFSDSFSDASSANFSAPIENGKLRVTGDILPLLTAKNPLLRKTFAVNNTVRRARVYATALGLYELYLNGQRVGQDYFTPGWTIYPKRLEYQVYDVTSLILSGNNAIGAILGNGWYQSEGWIRTPVAGTTRSLRAQLEIEFTDGTTQRINSDTSWKSSVLGPIAMSSIYNGETYDARKEIPGWATGSFGDASWGGVRDVSTYGGKLVAKNSPNIRVMQNLAPVRITNPSAGTYIVDMGQNMVGWAQLRVQGAAGTTVRMRFAEMLNPNGTLYTANLRGAQQTDTYILRGSGTTETYEPHFTYHGFRYVELTGFPGTPTLSAITGRVVYAALPETTTLVTSNPTINRLQQNIVWGQRGNFFAVPTDCPQRDERMGYLGDGQVFAGTAAYNMDVSGYFTKWMQDIEDEQFANGDYPVIAPTASLPLTPSSAWREAGVIIPWSVYQAYGDTGIINKYWSSMTRFISYMQSISPGYRTPASASQYGDWLNVGEDPPRDLLATAYYGHVVNLMARMARATGRTTEANNYDALFNNIRNAFNSAYVAADGKMTGNAQAAYAMAIAMDMLLPERVAGAANYLVQNIRAHGNHLTTGFIGTKDLNVALSKAGHTNVAYDLLNQTSYPSWLFSIQNGATTIWERWDGWTPTGGFQDPGMNSFNHYSFGAVGEWMYGTIGGIRTDPQRPGYKGSIIRPQPGGGLTSAKMEYQSNYGKIVSDWQIVNGGATMNLKVQIPANTTATVYVPTNNLGSVTEGGVAASSAPGVTFLRMEGGAAVYSVGSGSYSFSSNLTGTPPPPTPGGTWTHCADEGGTCSFTGTRLVRYGANNLYIYASFTNSVACNNTSFGDPAPGVAKQCHYGDGSPPTPTRTTTPPPGGNLALGKAASSSLPCNATSETAPMAVDGSASTKWCSSDASKWLQVDLGSSVTVNNFIIKHAGAGGEDLAWNTRDFMIETSADNLSWSQVVNVVANMASQTSHPITARSARYVRLRISTPTSNGDSAARIYELEVYGSTTPPTATATRTNTAGASATPTRTNTAGPSATRTSTTPAGTSIKVNFQLASGAAYPGYLIDGGAVYAARGNGQTYGWNVDNTTWARDRNAANSPDERYDTLNHMQKGAGSVWEIALPNGSYSVRIVAGDPSNFDSVYNITAEGVTVVSGTPNTTTRWFDGTQSVTVSDGRLTMANGTGSSNNKIAFIDITGGTPPTATRTNTTGIGTPTATRTRTSTTSAPTATRTSTSATGTLAWAPNVAYAQGARVSYGGLTYQCLQAHTSQTGWEPPNTPSLWQLV